VISILIALYLNKGSSRCNSSIGTWKNNPIQFKPGSVKRSIDLDKEGIPQEVNTRASGNIGFI
jgi:hypothetical protein